MISRPHQQIIDARTRSVMRAYRAGADIELIASEFGISTKQVRALIARHKNDGEPKPERVPYWARRVR